jgi:dihydroorotate dehydrogenase
MRAEPPNPRPVYKLFRPILFLFDAERAHRLTFGLLTLLYAIPGLRRLVRALGQQRTPVLPVTLMGLTLPNPVGLAAGLDKNAEHADFFADCGFGFVELGTVTPRPQPGNPRPRLFRLPRQRAVLNRMGFNNAGVDAFIENLAKHRGTGMIGINLGKNKDTPNEKATDDYLIAMRTAYCEADYLTINISSPNTPGLRSLQQGDELERLLRALVEERDALAQRHKRRVPLALKIAPDLDDEQVGEIARLLLAHRFDAVIATNTTITRPGLDQEPLAAEAGGLSGQPVKPLATHVIALLYRHLQGRIPIIGVGGITTAEDAWEKLVAGADAVQVYSALIYEGPLLAQRIVRGLAVCVQAMRADSLAAALAVARRQS